MELPERVQAAFDTWREKCKDHEGCIACCLYRFTGTQIDGGETYYKFECGAVLDDSHYDEDSDPVIAQKYCFDHHVRDENGDVVWED